MDRDWRDNELNPPDFSAMAWNIAVQGKGGREIAALHESWAAGLISTVPEAYDDAQGHLDDALSAWAGYGEMVLVARAWCLKGLCSSEAGDFLTAAASFKESQRFAEEAEDVPLMLRVMANRAICEIRCGDPKAAASHARRAFVKAEAEGDTKMTLIAHCVRASSYQMAGNFLAACNEHEAAAKLVGGGTILPPEPSFTLFMDTNFGICVLRSGKPERAASIFERALDTVRDKLGGKPPLRLARCLFHVGEARRQAREFVAARDRLDEAASIVATGSAEGTDTKSKSKWGALAVEVANARGLCGLAEAAHCFSGEMTAAAETISPRVNSISRRDSDDTDSASGSGTSTRRDRHGSQTIEEGGGVNLTGRRQRRRQAETESAAERAATIIAAGSKAGESGAHPIQRANNAVLEGIAWSLAGRSGTKGVAALSRAEKVATRHCGRSRRRSGDKQRPSTSGPSSAPGQTSEVVGESVPAGSETDDHLQTLQLGVLCSQGSVLRGGFGMGAGCSTVVAARSLAASSATPPKDGSAALAAVAAARAAAKAASAGWADAAQLVKKQLAYAAKVTAGSARQLALAHAHNGGIDLMTGKPSEAAECFKRQRVEAQKAGDINLEALAERNLADTREADDDPGGALRHLRRCRALAQTGRNAALEADTCRRLSTVYAEIASEFCSSRHGDASDVGGGGGADVRSDGREEGDTIGELMPKEEGHAPDNTLRETEIGEREDNDLAFLHATAGRRARLFAEHYETAVLGSRWPVTGRIEPI